LDNSKRPPLAVARLRGGLLGDDQWVRLPSQPAIITSTVDQLGSRLLFRNYGGGDLTASIYAGLAGNDSLIILDEAHCAQPFMQTLRAVKRFRGTEWAEQPVAPPFAAVIMSATPPREVGKRFPAPDRHDEALNHPALRQRLTASKPAELRIIAKSAARKKDAASDAFTAESLALVKRFLDEHGCRRMAVMVNRVRTAQDVAALLRAELGKRAGVDLLIGPMRALERDDLVARLTPIFAAVENPAPLEQPRVLITTQCLEVGADFSFDALVTDARASTRCVSVSAA
jgi:CRISPR-associated endonuclease/helicase Cas3